MQVLTTIGIGFVLLMLLISGCDFSEDSNQVPAIIFLGWDENEKNQLYRQISGKEAVQISEAEDGSGFAMSKIILLLWPAI